VAVIGVAARAADRWAVEEFFELFKTPWEPAVPGRRYSIVVSADGLPVAAPGALTMIYGAAETPWDRDTQVRLSLAGDAPDVAPSEEMSAILAWGADRLPIYGRLATFDLTPAAQLRASGAAADYRVDVSGARVHRVGYDLFGEVRRLLTSGQPAWLADTATLELHIDFLRRAIAAARLPIIEVPPAPWGSEFACSLTHDIDFFGIRRHRADRTLGGFLLRATVGSVADACLGRRPFAEAARNVAAALALPLVFMGLRRDPWQPLDDYAAADRGLPSTFFMVPFRDRAGVGPDGRVEAMRAVKYGAGNVATEMRRARRTGVEFALHGLDAWREVAAGRAERDEVARAAETAVAGVRMHWLYFSDGSPRLLEEAGFTYDSTCGHNDAVGYRAGTMQIYRPEGCSRLLELPLTIMDTAMFYARRMNVSRARAHDRCLNIFDAASRFGGAVVINWHDRSLAPERQWHRTYSALLDQLQARRVWFATASDVVAWFRWRRQIRFVAGSRGDDVVVDAPPAPAGLPAARLVRRAAGDASPDERLFAGGAVTLTP
jgi:hypothetical protein